MYKLFLLIRPPGGESEYAPLGFLYVAAFLEEKGYQVEVIDMNIGKMKIEDIIQQLKQPHYSALAAIGITAMNTEYRITVELAKAVKTTLPNTKIIVGGPLSSNMPREILSEDVIDYIVVGEGEESCFHLLEKLTAKDFAVNDIPGVGFKTSSSEIIINKNDVVIDINKLPWPARHKVNMEKYVSRPDNRFGDCLNGKPLRSTRILGSRGCPYHCVYCDHSVFGYKYRKRNVEDIVKEMKYLSKTYNINAVIFSDDILDLDKMWFRELCDEMIKEKCNLIWGFQSRVNHADLENYTHAYKAGARYVSFGIEFGTDDMLKKSKKKFTVNQAHNAINTAKKAGLRVLSGFMIGMVDEKKEQIEQTIKFAVESKLDSGGWSIATPIPQTEMYDMAKKNGLIDRDELFRADRSNNRISLTPYVSDKELRYLLRKADWNFFWSRPGRKLPQILKDLLIKSYPFLDFITRGKIRDYGAKLDAIRKKIKIPFFY